MNCCSSRWTSCHGASGHGTWRAATPATFGSLEGAVIVSSQLLVERDGMGREADDEIAADLPRSRC